jgi:hypothetical protein
MLTARLVFSLPFLTSIPSRVPLEINQATIRLIQLSVNLAALKPHQPSLTCPILESNCSESGNKICGWLKI